MIDIFVGQMFSQHTSFTFDFYSLNWCPSDKGPAYDPAKFGTTLTGAPLHESPYNHKFGYDRNVQLCKKSMTDGEVAEFSYKI